MQVILGAVLNEWKALVAGIVSSSLAEKAKRFPSPPFEKHSPAAAMLSLQDLAGELSDLDHVGKARRPMS